MEQKYFETFNEQLHLEDFKKGKIVINCSTEKMAYEFLEYCDKKHL